MISPAPWPRMWAPRILLLPCSTRTLAKAALSAWVMDERQDVMSLDLASNFRPAAVAFSSVRPTLARVGTVNTALGMLE